MASDAGDIGLGHACFIKHKMQRRMQNKLDNESQVACDEWIFNLCINNVASVILSSYKKA